MPNIKQELNKEYSKLLGMIVKKYVKTPENQYLISELRDDYKKGFSYGGMYRMLNWLEKNNYIIKKTIRKRGQSTIVTLNKKKQLPFFTDYLCLLVETERFSMYTLKEINDSFMVAWDIYHDYMSQNVMKEPYPPDTLGSINWYIMGKGVYVADLTRLAVMAITGQKINSKAHFKDVPD